MALIVLVILLVVVGGIKLVEKGSAESINRSVAQTMANRKAFQELVGSDVLFDAIDAHYRQPELLSIANELIATVPGLEDIRLAPWYELNAVPVRNLLHAIDGTVKNGEGETFMPRMWPLYVLDPSNRDGFSEISLSREQMRCLMQLFQDELRRSGLDVHAGWRVNKPQIGTWIAYKYEIMCQWMGCENYTCIPLPTSIPDPSAIPPEDIEARRKRLHDAIQVCTEGTIRGDPGREARIRVLGNPRWNGW